MRLRRDPVNKNWFAKTKVQEGKNPTVSTQSTDKVYFLHLFCPNQEMIGLAFLDQDIFVM